MLFRSSIGLTTGLDPAMTLGCGGYGGNITSDNISPKHLLNIKRLAYEVRPANAPATTSISTPTGVTAAPSTAVTPPLDFVCEEDVRVAIRAGRQLVVSERAIITPAARELADANRVLTVAPWRG